jgi:hypothetical protein
MTNRRQFFATALTAILGAPLAAKLLPAAPEPIEIVRIPNPYPAFYPVRLLPPIRRVVLTWDGAEFFPHSKIGDTLTVRAPMRYRVP